MKICLLYILFHDVVFIKQLSNCSWQQILCEFYIKAPLGIKFRRQISSFYLVNKFFFFSSKERYLLDLLCERNYIWVRKRDCSPTFYPGWR